MSAAYERIGQRIAKYQIVRLLGEGGMGAVYEAVHEQLRRRAAIKVLHPELSRQPEIARRFEREALASSQIHHPGIVTVYEIEQLADGSSAIVMEYLDGETLGQRLARGPLDGPEALRLGRQIAAALAAAHAQEIVHRDLKPDNLMLVPEPEMPGGARVKILDFGIAKVRPQADAHAERTRTGLLMGTPTYMAPEQCRGAGLVDAKADVYSLGVILYQGLAGAPPFQAEGMGALLVLHLTEPPPPLSARAPHAPAALVGLIHQMLDKDPARRPSMEQVAALLAPADLPRAPTPPRVHAALDAASPAHPSTLRQAAAQIHTPPAGRRRGALGVVAGVAVLGAAGLLLVMLQGRSDPPLDRADPRIPPAAQVGAVAPPPLPPAAPPDTPDLGAPPAEPGAAQVPAGSRPDPREHHRAAPRPTETPTHRSRDDRPAAPARSLPSSPKDELPLERAPSGAAVAAPERPDPVGAPAAARTTPLDMARPARVHKENTDVTKFND